MPRMFNRRVVRGLLAGSLALGIHKILASRRGDGPYPVPLTRRDLYAAEH